MKDPFIITFAHEKGGTGKSTLSTHLAIGLMYYNKNFKVSFVDLDSRQLSSWNFFNSRINYKYNVPNLFKCEKLTTSLKDSKKDSFNDDCSNLYLKIHSLKESDFIILDVAGSYNNYMVAALSITDLLITPVNESFFDIDSIINLSKMDKSIMSGPFYTTVFEERKQRALKKQESLHWSVIINRASPIYSDNSQKIQATLKQISKNLNFSLDYTVKDRQIYKELCDHGLTIFDVPGLASDINMVKMKAHSEMDQMVYTILDKYLKVQNKLFATG